MIFFEKNLGLLKFSIVYLIVSEDGKLRFCSIESIPFIFYALYAVV